MRNQEITTGWSEVTRANASDPLPYRAFTDEEMIRGNQAASWDPYEVWLTRVKKPRDRAAISLAARYSTPTSDLSE